MMMRLRDCRIYIHRVEYEYQSTELQKISEILVSKKSKFPRIMREIPLYRGGPEALSEKIDVVIEFCGCPP
jgi:hypothetical protein